MSLDKTNNNIKQDIKRVILFIFQYDVRLKEPQMPLLLKVLLTQVTLLETKHLYHQENIITTVCLAQSPELSHVERRSGQLQGVT